MTARRRLLSRDWLSLGLLLALVTAVYGQAAGFDYLNWDDDVYVYNNSVVSRGLTVEGWNWAWRLENPPYYIPLTWLSYMLSVEIAGLDPGALHLGNVFLHGLSTLLLFLLFRLATGSQLRSLLLAALFAVHPLHVEPVLWIAQRKEVLSTFFALAATLCYMLRARRGLPSPLLSFWALFLFTLSLLSKPMWLPLPALLLLMDYWPLRRGTLSDRCLLREKIPYLLIAIVVLTINVPNLSHESQLLQSVDVDPFAEGLAAIPVSYALILWKTIVPLPLAMPYTYFSHGISATIAVASTALLLALTLLAVRFRRRTPSLLFGWCWFLLSAATVLFSFGSGGISPVADRWAYVPHIGLFAGIIWALPRPNTKPGAFMVLGLGVLAVTGSAALAAVQVGHWRDASTWWRHVTAVTEDNHVATWLWGVHEWEIGNRTRGEHLMRQSLRINPREPFYSHRLALNLLAAGREDEALDVFRQLLDNPLSSARSLTESGMLILRQYGADEAEAFLRAASDRAGPTGLHAQIPHFYLWAVLVSKGNHEAAREAFERLVRAADGSLPLVCGRFGPMLSAFAEEDAFWVEIERSMRARCG